MAIVSFCVVMVAIFSLTTSDSVLTENEQKLFRFQRRVERLHQELVSKCPELSIPDKREVLSRVDVMLLAEKSLYNKLIDLLVVCGNSKTSGNSQIATNPPTTTHKPRPTRSKPATNMPSHLRPCISNATVNLTEFWRNHYTRGNSTSPTNSKTSEDQKRLPVFQYFRISGAAGARIRDSCPKKFECGSEIGYWSDGSLPKGLGESRFLTVYPSKWNGRNSTRSDCKPTGSTLTILATRCSEDGDILYRMFTKTDREPLLGTICGMD